MLHERIRLARRHAGLSQAALAAAVGVQRSAVSHWEAVVGKQPSMSHLRQAALVLRVQFEWLATGRGAMAISRKQQFDSVAAVQGLLVDDLLELRLISAFREAPSRARASFVEIVEQMAQQRTGASRRPAAAMAARALSDRP